MSGLSPTIRLSRGGDTVLFFAARARIDKKQLGPRGGQGTPPLRLADLSGDQLAHAGHEHGTTRVTMCGLPADWERVDRRSGCRFTPSAHVDWPCTRVSGWALSGCQRVRVGYTLRRRQPWSVSERMNAGFLGVRLYHGAGLRSYPDRWPILTDVCGHLALHGWALVGPSTSVQLSVHLRPPKLVSWTVSWTDYA